MKYFFTMLTFALFMSCGGSDGVSCDINDLNDEIADELAALDATGLAYANDPTTANCEAWKSAGQTYLDAIEGFDSSCDGLSQSQYDQVIQGAQAALAAIPCF